MFHLNFFAMVFKHEIFHNHIFRKITDCKQSEITKLRLPPQRLKESTGVITGAKRFTSPQNENTRK